MAVWQELLDQYGIEDQPEPLSCIACWRELVPGHVIVTGRAGDIYGPKLTKSTPRLFPKRSTLPVRVFDPLATTNAPNGWTYTVIDDHDG